MKKMLFLINPVSGKLALNDCLMDVVDIFAKAEYEINIHLTQSVDDMVETAKKDADKYDTIVCCGGDGTLNIVAGALFSCQSKTVIGYIPGGTTNDFANSRRINTFAPAAAEQIAHGTVRDVDIGQLNGETFIYVAAFGIFTDVSYQTSREMKTNLGHAAYLLEGMKSLMTAKAYPVRISCDSHEIEGDFIYGMVSNSRRVGGFEMPIMKSTLYDDGEMEVCLVRKPKNAVETQKLINALVTQTADENMIYLFKTKNIKFESEQEIPWTLDGEFGGSFTDSEISVKEAAIKMVF